jgi:hypothetical protein
LRRDRRHSPDAVAHMRGSGPAMSAPEAAMRRLLSLMARLRDPERGCPWDLKQTFASIAPFTIEEAYEVADAIERHDQAHLRDELGDLLFKWCSTPAWPRNAAGSTLQRSPMASRRS